MKKNGLLTFIFACIPGAGQMYYGYMQRGLSIAMILILCVMAATVIQPLLFLCLVIWMYSFFDTYDLIRHMAAGEPKEDSLSLLSLTFCFFRSYALPFGMVRVAGFRIPQVERCAE